MGEPDFIDAPPEAEEPAKPKRKRASRAKPKPEAGPPKEKDAPKDAAPEDQEHEDQEAPEPAAPRFRVTLNCPTPLMHQTLEVEADTEVQAKAAFCRANGISDSVHTWTVERVQ